jgi:hypothetical protein
MKTIERTAKKILIEATKYEMNYKGFDALWDEVRDIYPAIIYEVESIEESEDEKFLLIRLRLKKY